MLRIRPSYRGVRWCLRKGATELMPVIAELRRRPIQWAEMALL
jgi:hypothetical protein